MRPVLRAFSTVLIAAGVLLLADAGLTLAWQEPVSALYARMTQNALGDDLERGDAIVLEMPYARFEYEVERTRIVDPDAFWVTNRVGYERLVLSACHPLYSAAQRVVVFARQVRVEPRGASLDT